MCALAPSICGTENRYPTVCSRRGSGLRSSEGGRSGSKGLRHFSMKVCEKVEGKGRTTYNEVADELVTDLPNGNDPGELDQYAWLSILWHRHHKATFTLACHVLEDLSVVQELALNANVQVEAEAAILAQTISCMLSVFGPTESVNCVQNRHRLIRRQSILGITFQNRSNMLGIPK